MCLRNKIVSEILHASHEACYENSLECSLVSRWVNEFKNGSTRVEDNQLAERGISATDKYYIDKLRKLLKSDRRLACDDISQEVNISVGIVYSILRNSLIYTRFPLAMYPIDWR